MISSKDVGVEPKKSTLNEPVKILCGKWKNLCRKQIDLVLIKWRHIKGDSLMWDIELVVRDRYL